MKVAMRTKVVVVHKSGDNVWHI